PAHASLRQNANWLDALRYPTPLPSFHDLDVLDEQSFASTVFVGRRTGLTTALLVERIAVYGAVRGLTVASMRPLR
ncbi:MAG: hypothetical protein WCA32_17195, partial [Chromatiaceae bacterium]